MANRAGAGDAEEVMAIVLDFLVPEADVEEAPALRIPHPEDPQLANLSRSLLEQPRPDLLREPPPPVEPHLTPALWTDFFGVL